MQLYVKSFKKCLVHDHSRNGSLTLWYRSTTRRFIENERNKYGPIPRDNNKRQLKDREYDDENDHHNDDENVDLNDYRRDLHDYD